MNAFELTGGEASDGPMFEILLDTGPDATPRAVVADKGYDSDTNRDLARQRGAVPYSGVPVGTIKRHATGKGNAPKQAMIDAMRERGHAPADDNEADALALLHWAIETNGGLA